MTLLIEEILQKITDEQFEFSKHAVDQSILRQIRVEEIREIIKTRPLLKIITLYEPDPRRWNNDFTQRRNRNDE